METAGGNRTKRAEEEQGRGGLHAWRPPSAHPYSQMQEKLPSHQTNADTKGT